MVSNWLLECRDVVAYTTGELCGVALLSRLNIMVMFLDATMLEEEIYQHTPKLSFSTNKAGTQHGAC